MSYGYPNLHAYGWKCGIHKAPLGYEHPWLVVFSDYTQGAWNREEAREVWKERKYVDA